jgi:hypothetical protein
VSRLQPPPQKLESFNFGSRCFLGQLDALHTQNFDNFFFRVDAIQIFGFQRILMHTSYCMQVYNIQNLNIMEVNQYAGSLHAPY